MLVLALDTSSSTTTVAVTRDGVVLAGRSEQAPNRHAEVLTPLIDVALRQAAVARTDIDVVAVGVGPGPFTGLRVGVVTALSLADALGVPALGASSLDAIARHASRSEDGFTVLTDARRKEVYWASYQDGARTAGPAVARPADLARQLPAGTTLVGTGALMYADAFSTFRVDDTSPYPDAADVATLALDERWVAPVEPMYLRRPDARPPGPPKRVTPA